MMQFGVVRKIRQCHEIFKDNMTKRQKDRQTQFLKE